MPRTAWILFAGTFVNRFGTFVLPFLVLYMTDRGYSKLEAGLAVAAYGMGGVGAMTLGGLLADRMGRRNSIALSMFSGAAFTLALSQARTLPLILPFAALVGMSAELYRPASSALIADVVSEEQRVTAFALYRFAINLGWAFGPALGGVMAHRSFFLLFAADAATSGAFGLIALSSLPHGVRSSRDEERRGEAARALLADRGFLLFLGAVLAMAILYMQAASTFALHVRDSGLSEETYGLLLSLNGLIIVFAELPLSSWTMRRRPTRIIAVGSLLLGLGYLWNVVAHSAPVLATGVTLWTLGEMLESPVASAFVAGRSPRRLRGRYQGAFGATFAVAAIIGPIVGTAVYSLSPDAVWVGCGLLGVLGAWLVTVAGRHPAP